MSSFRTKTAAGALFAVAILVATGCSSSSKSTSAKSATTTTIASGKTTDATAATSSVSVGSQGNTPAGWPSDIKIPSAFLSTSSVALKTGNGPSMTVTGTVNGADRLKIFKSIEANLTSAGYKLGAESGIDNPNMKTDLVNATKGTTKVMVTSSANGAGSFISITVTQK